MVNKVIIRKDLTIDVNRLARIFVQAGRLIEAYDNTQKVEVLEAMFSQELHDLEAKLIENGYHFQWIEDNNAIVGLLVVGTDANMPEFLQPYKPYTPDANISNLSEVKAEHINRMKNIKQ